MKILHMTHTSIPDDARILRELDALSQLPDASLIGIGREAQVRSSTVRDLDYVHLETPKLRATAWRRLPAPVRHSLALAEMTLRFARVARRATPDVVHCHDVNVLPAGLLATVGRPAVLVYDAHELESQKSGLSARVSRAIRAVESWAWPRVDGLITVSPSIVEWYNRNLGRKPSLCVLNSPQTPPLRDSLGSVPASNLRESLELDDSTKLFVYVGGLEHGRGIELILESIEYWDVDTHVCFLGAGTMGETIREAGRADARVHLHEPVPHDHLVSFLGDTNGAFCLIEDVSLSDRYCLPNKLFECAFAEVPVVASRLPDIARVVEEYQLGVCTDSDPHSLTSAIGRCLEAGPPRREALRELSWEYQARELRDFYVRMTSAPRNDDIEPAPELQAAVNAQDAQGHG